MMTEDADATILEDMDSDMDMSAEVNYNYDIVNLKEKNHPCHQAIRDILEVHNKRTGDIDEDEFDLDKIMQSKSLLAVEIQIYMQLDNPQTAYLVIASDVSIFLYKEKKNIVVTPFKV